VGVSKVLREVGRRSGGFGFGEDGHEEPKGSQIASSRKPAAGHRLFGPYQPRRMTSNLVCPAPQLFSL
jgi:hypothetical protein